jgi:hypothetical protein
MRKVTRIIGLMCMAAVLAVGSTSCKKDNNVNASFTFAWPAIEGFSTGERAYIDPTDACQVKWWEGDQMMVYNLDATNPSNSVAEVFTAVSGCQGTYVTPFTGPSLGGKKSGGFFAFYPADKADLSLLAQNNRGKFAVGATQTIDRGIQYGPGFENRFFMDPRSVVSANTADDFMTQGADLTLKHIFGFANLRVKSNSGDKLVRSLTIHDKKLHLTGPIEINILDITNDRLSALQTLGQQYADGQINFESYWASLQSTLSEMGYTSNGQGFDVTLTCADNDPSITIDDSKKYFIIPLRPGALVGGFDVVVTYDDDTTETRSFEGQQYIVRPGRFVNIDVVL